jgi:release factor glutamine methyltransferase
VATIQTILASYRPEIDNLDLELILAHELKKSREFVLAHPEYKISENLIRQLAEKIARRRRGEPLAHILGHKEFYGLDFKVTKDTLIPRPETELLVETATCNMKHATCNKNEAIKIIDIGTGSGNIIISIAKAIESKNLLHASCYMLYGIDISEKALIVAKHNAKKNNVAGKIKFLQGNLLEPILKDTRYKIQDTRYLLLANLPYLSKEIYSATLPTVKNFEPKSALYSPKAGLDHYEKLLKQIQALRKNCYMLNASCFMEISPEQKKALTALIKKKLPSAKIEFKKDLAGKWRVCVISLN